MNAQRAIETARLIFGPDSLELLKREFPCTEGSRGHALVYAENAKGESVGKRDQGPWAEYRPMGDWA